MKINIALAFILLTCFPCHAQKAMMFNSVDQYINDAHEGIWIVEAGKDQPLLNANGEPPYKKVKVVRVLKGDALSVEMRVRAVFRDLGEKGENSGESDRREADNGSCGSDKVVRTHFFAGRVLRTTGMII